MLIVTSIILAAQATIITPPATNARDLKAVDNVKSMLLQAPKPSGQPDHPTIVEAGRIQSAAGVVRSERRMQEAASRDGRVSAMWDVPRDVAPGCQRVADHPAGAELRDSRTLHARSTVLDCGAMVMHIYGENMARPLKLMIAVGFPQDAAAAVVNGGALAKSFRESRDGLRQVTYRWVGRSVAYTISLTSDRLSLGAMTGRADAAVDALTRRR